MAGEHSTQSLVWAVGREVFYWGLRLESSASEWPWATAVGSCGAVLSCWDGKHLRGALAQSSCCKKGFGTKSRGRRARHLDGFCGGWLGLSAGGFFSVAQTLKENVLFQIFQQT